MSTKTKGQTGFSQSEWATINAGVPQETVLGPAGFLWHINDLHTTCDSTISRGRCTFWESCSEDCSESQLLVAADQAYEWSEINLMRINPDKTKAMEITFTHTDYDIPSVCICNHPLESVTTFKLLGIIFSSDLTWGAHVDYLYRKFSRRLYVLVMIKRAGVSTRDILRIYLTMIGPVLEYACQVWHTSLSGAHSDKLESVKRRALHIIYPDLSHAKAHSQSGLSLLSKRREDLCRAFFKDLLSPSHRLHHLLPVPRDSPYALRNRALFPRIRARCDRFRKTLVAYRLQHWQ